ncbi:uncharacterized protein [Macrobrachium rosenbergii]|uniref:uncharacterized protein n=1 Tax=Macrobrachium rosenbergii TaxID=79674 RepID=UPI0034D44DCD
MELGDEAKVQSEVEVLGNDEESTMDAERVSEGSGQQHRKKTPCAFISDNQERMLWEWLQQHPFLYDRGLAEFKEVAKKTGLPSEKAKSLNLPLIGTQLSTWLKSIRTRYGRLTRTECGQAAVRELMDRERWILTTLSFFGKHIVRQKKPKTLGLKESAAAAAAAAALPDAPDEVDAAGGDDDE